MATEMIDWVDTLDDVNFLAVYDVILDIRHEVQLNPKDILIPLSPDDSRIPPPQQSDYVSDRDKRAKYREKALGCLERMSLIRYRPETVLDYIYEYETQVVITVTGFGLWVLYEYLAASYEKRFSARTQTPDCLEITIWKLLHPSIVRVAKTRYDAGHHADAVEAAMKEVNNAVKEIYRNATGREIDGADLMHAAFSKDKAVIVIGDTSTQSGKSMQQGYMELYAGAIMALRNPAAHNNVQIDDSLAMHQLFMASLLMFTLDARLSPK